MTLFDSSMNTVWIILIIAIAIAVVSVMFKPLSYIPYVGPWLYKIPILGPMISKESFAVVQSLRNDTVYPVEQPRRELINYGHGWGCNFGRGTCDPWPKVAALRGGDVPPQPEDIIVPRQEQTNMVMQGLQQPLATQILGKINDTGVPKTYTDYTTKNDSMHKSIATILEGSNALGGSRLVGSPILQDFSTPTTTITDGTPNVIAPTMQSSSGGNIYPTGISPQVVGSDGSVTQSTSLSDGSKITTTTAPNGITTSVTTSPDGTISAPANTTMPIGNNANPMTPLGQPIVQLGPNMTGQNAPILK
jgi:hypothetical protein